MLLSAHKQRTAELVMVHPNKGKASAHPWRILGSRRTLFIYCVQEIVWYVLERASNEY